MIRRTLLAADAPLAAGRYALWFDTSAYFRAHAIDGFYPEVVVTFDVAEAVSGVLGEEVEVPSGGSALHRGPPGVGRGVQLPGRQHNGEDPRDRAGLGGVGVDGETAHVEQRG